MKHILIFAALLFSAVFTYGQENRVTLSGGYAFANIEESDTDGTGWRINGLYEFNPGQGKFAHGLSVGYVSLSGDATGASYDVGTWPIYYAPKFMFGSEKFQGYLKGALGWQFSNIKRTGNFSELEDNDSGFTLGAGAGVLYNFNDKVFLDAGYEFLWLNNSFYKEGYLNTASLGIGFKF